MRLIYVADVHGAFERVKQLLDETVADVYIIAGDLVDISFHTSRAAVRYHDLQTYFHSLRRGRGKSAMILEDFVDELLEDPQLSSEIMEKGTRYRHKTLHARRVLRQSYRLMENMISLGRQKHVFCLPGNHDMDLRHTALRKRDLHLACHEAGPLRIAGYGGASGQTPGIPERYVVKYRAGAGTSEENNEMYRFLNNVRPHVIVSHQPAYGIHDFASPMGETGSFVLRKYCERFPVLLCLTGHLHDEWGIVETDDTIYLNPSHFGQITRRGGRIAEGGFFYEVEMEKDRVNQIKHKKLADGIIYDVIAYNHRGEQWEQVVLDRGRYEALLTGRNYETEKEKKSTGADNILDQHLRRFYELFQKTRLGEKTSAMEQAIRLLDAGLPEDFAVDVMVGSKEGKARDADVDLILYLRCGLVKDTPCPSEIAATCPRCLHAKQKISEILWEKSLFNVVDCIDLDRLEQSIRDRNYECLITQRFVSYRSMGLLVNEHVIAPIESLLAADEEFLREIEGSIGSYFSILIDTIQHVRSFQKYESHLKTIGITIPEPITRKLKAYLAEE